MASIEDIKKLLSPLIEQLEKLHISVNKLTNNTNTNNKKYEELEKELRTKEEQIENLERKAREKNVIIHGIEEEKYEKLEDKVPDLLKNKMRINNINNENIEELKRLGKYKEGTKYPRPILLELISKRFKKDIKANLKNLKGTKIYIDEDYSRKTIEERRLLLPHLKKARADGCKANLMYNLLYINGKPYKISDFTETYEPEEIDEIPILHLRRKSISLMKLPTDGDTDDTEEEGRENINEEGRKRKEKGTPIEIKNLKQNQEKCKYVNSPNAKSKQKKQEVVSKGPLDNHIQTRARQLTVTKN